MTNVVWFHLYEVPRVVKFIETESTMVVGRAWEMGGNEELLFNGHRVLVLQDKRAVEMDSNNDCSTGKCVPMNCTFING